MTTPKDKYTDEQIEAFADKLGSRHWKESFKAGFKKRDELGLGNVMDAWPNEKEVDSELWRRVHKREDCKDYEIPQKMVREIVAQAYWNACSEWLKSHIEEKLK